MNILSAVLIFAGLFLVVFIFGAPFTYDARAEDEEPR
jgi:hypothetical protein